MCVPPSRDPRGVILTEGRVDVSELASGALTGDDERFADIVKAKVQHFVKNPNLRGHSGATLTVSFRWKPLSGKGKSRADSRPTWSASWLRASASPLTWWISSSLPSSSTQTRCSSAPHCIQTQGRRSRRRSRPCRGFAPDGMENAHLRRWRLGGRHGGLGDATIRYYDPVKSGRRNRRKSVVKVSNPTPFPQSLGGGGALSCPQSGVKFSSEKANSHTESWLARLSETGYNNWRVFLFPETGRLKTRRVFGWTQSTPPSRALWPR